MNSWVSLLPPNRGLTIVAYSRVNVDADKQRQVLVQDRVGGALLLTSSMAQQYGNSHATHASEGHPHVASAPASQEKQKCSKARSYCAFR